METVWRVLTRKKILDPISAEQSELGRILNTLDLTALGVGSTLGVGVYVLAGQVARNTAGPAVIISFLIATIASVFAGLCYAEFGARAPRAGSAYIYSYVCVGEFIAFVIGWNLILEYVIGSASVARGLSLYVDTLTNGTLNDTFTDIAPIKNIDFMSSYFDFFAFGVSILLAVALAFGLKESKWANNIFTLVNVAVVVFVVIAGGVKANTENWDRRPTSNSTNDTTGDGGFFPFGIEGVIKGAATCFYGFVGFDCIATTGEEVKNPKKAIPLAIILSLFIIFLAYFGTSTVITLMVPYYNLDPNAPLPRAFEKVGLEWAKWVVAVGGIFGLCASLFGAMFPLPRIIYAMASDSLIFQFLGKVSQRFKTPVTGTLLAGLLTGLMAALFDLEQLVKMMSIGTLLAYTIVAASVLLLRYQVDKDETYEPLMRSASDSDENDTYSTDTRGLDVGQSDDDLEMMTGGFYSHSYLRQIFNCGRSDFPSEKSERLVKFEVCLYCLTCLLIGLCAMYLKNPIVNGEIYAIVLTSVVIGLAVLLLMSITTQPKSRKELSFKVPLVPLIPALSILINIYLMLMLDRNTWIRFGVWMSVGIPIYYFSVKTHSDARNESISSITSKEKHHHNHQTNGYVNHGFEPNNEIKKKSPAPPPPTLQKIEETIANLDEILENAEADIDRKISIDSISNASNVLHEESVQADVHCSDVPVTPIQEAPPLLQSSDVVVPPPENPVSDVASTLDQECQKKEESAPEIEEEASRSQDQQNTENEENCIGDHLPQTEIIDIDKVDGVIGVPPPPPDESVILREKDIPVVPPPPPPPPAPEDTDVHIPRPSIRLSAITTAKLKPVAKIPETPPVDYSRQNTQIDGPDEDNIKFGTQEYKEFLEKLDQTLQQGKYVPTRVSVDFKKKPAPERPFTSPVPNVDVIEDEIDRDDAKKKLAQFLARTNSMPSFELKDRNRSKWDNVKPDEVDLNGYEEQHRQNMENIFRSVRLRKRDSFKENPEEKRNTIHINKVDTTNSDDRLQHQQNMDNIFKSIRLRKVDSFKKNSNESQDD